MPVSYAQIQRYSNSLKTVTQNAAKELSERLARLDTTDLASKRYAIKRHFQAVMNKYGLSAQELAAQWYEYCASAAGVNVDSALLPDMDLDAMNSRLDALIDSIEETEEWERFEEQIRTMAEETMRELSRETITSNLDRDSSADRRSGRDRGAGYARVPVGETCAWCLMLASLGYHYRSYESAGGIDPDHFHMNCDCVVVPYHEPKLIRGYNDYNKYLDMYSAANSKPESEYSPELAARIAKAKAKHDADYAAGKTNTKWTPYNETLIVMRDMYGLSH